MNKTFTKHDPHLLLVSFFSKMYNKKNYLSQDAPFKDELSVEAGSFENGEAIYNQKGASSDHFKGAQFLTVFDSCDKYADNYFRNTTFFLLRDRK